MLSGAVPSEAHVSAVHEQTEGNPLFVREVVRLLASEPALQRTGRRGVPIPGSVGAVIWRRLAPLSSDAVQVLSAGAVVGRGFDVALVEPMCKLPVERVLGGLSEAAALGVVTEDEGTSGAYRFSHSLMREVLYERLPIPARTQLHQLAAEAIERQYGTGSETHVAELARHFAEIAGAGGEASKALEYARRAGDRALGMYAYEEAVAEYQRALQALSFADPDEPEQCELLLRLGVAQSRRATISRLWRAACRLPRSADGLECPSCWPAPHWCSANGKSRAAWSTGSSPRYCKRRSTAWALRTRRFARSCWGACPWSSRSPTSNSAPSR